MTSACSSLPAARAKCLATFIYLALFYVVYFKADANEASQSAACGTGFLEACAHVDISASLVQAEASCEGLTQNQLHVRLLIGTTWAAETANNRAGLPQASPDADLVVNLTQYFEQPGIAVTVDVASSNGSSATRNGSWSSGEPLQDYAGWTTWPEAAAESAGAAQELPSTLLLQDRHLGWSDVLPEVRRMVALYGGKLQALPYAVEVPLVLYRRNALRTIGASPAETWPDLVTLLRQLQQQDNEQPHAQESGNTSETAGVGTSSRSSTPAPVSGFCNILPTGCSRDADLLISIWASLAVPSIRVPTSRADLKLLIEKQLGGDGNAAAAVQPLAGALQLYRSLMEMAPEAASHKPCTRPDLKVAMKECAVIVGYGSSLKAAIWQVGQEHRRRQRRLQQQQQQVAAMAMETVDLSCVLRRGRLVLEDGATGGIALVAPLPGTAFDAAVTCIANPVNQNSTTNSSSDNSDNSCSSACGSSSFLVVHPDGTSRGRVWRGVYLGHDALSYQINATVNPVLQYAAWRAAAKVLGQENSWNMVLLPVEGGVTVQRASQLTDVERWTRHGYDEYDITAYLEALRESLTGQLTFTAPRLPAALGAEPLEVLRGAANDAAFGPASNMTLLAQVTISKLKRAYDLNHAAFLDALAVHFGLEAFGKPEVEAQGNANGSLGLRGAKLIGVIISCLVAATAVLLFMLLVLWWKHLLPLGQGSGSGAPTLERTSSAPGFGPDTTLMLTDVQDSTRLWETLPAVVMDAALSLHNDAFRQLLPRFRGYECHTEGDSFVLAFYTAVEAAAFALEIQLVLLQVNWPQELLDHELCAVVRQAPPYSDSNEGGTPGATGQGAPFVASNEGGGGLQGSNGGIEEGLTVVGGGSNTLATSATRGSPDYGDLMAANPNNMEPWGLQAVDEEQAAVLNSDERLMKSLYRATSRRPPGRSRTFSTIQGLRVQERNSWNAGLRRQARQTDAVSSRRGGGRRDVAGAGVATADNAAEAWVEGRSLSDSRAELDFQGTSSRSYSGLVLDSDSATDTCERDSLVQLQPAPQVPPTGARPGAMPQQLQRQTSQLRPSQNLSSHSGGLEGGPRGLPWKHQEGNDKGETATALLALSGRYRSGWNLQLPPWFGTAATGGSGGGSPRSAADASSLSSGLAAAASAAVALDGNEEASLRLGLPLLLQRQSYSQQPSSGRATSQDLGGSRQLWRKSAEASINNSNTPLGNINIGAGLSNNNSNNNNILFSNNTNNANYPNTSNNSRSLILMRARNSTRSSAGTPTPPFTGLLATLRVSNDGEGEGGGGGGASTGAAAGALIGGVDFLLRAAFTSNADRRSPTAADEGGGGGISADSRDSIMQRLGLKHFVRGTSTSSLGGAADLIAEAPLIFVGDPLEKRRRRRQRQWQRHGSNMLRFNEMVAEHDSSGESALSRVESPRNSSPRNDARSLALCRLQALSEMSSIPTQRDEASTKTCVVAVVAGSDPGAGAELADATMTQRYHLQPSSPVLPSRNVAGWRMPEAEPGPAPGSAPAAVAVLELGSTPDSEAGSVSDVQKDLKGTGGIGVTANGTSAVQTYVAAGAGAEVKVIKGGMEQQPGHCPREHKRLLCVFEALQGDTGDEIAAGPQSQSPPQQLLQSDWDLPPQLLMLPLPALLVRPSAPVSQSKPLPMPLQQDEDVSHLESPPIHSHPQEQQHHVAHDLQDGTSETSGNHGEQASGTSSVGVVTACSLVNPGAWEATAAAAGGAASAALSSLLHSPSPLRSSGSSKQHATEGLLKRQPIGVAQGTMTAAPAAAAERTGNALPGNRIGSSNGARGADLLRIASSGLETDAAAAANSGSNSVTASGGMSHSASVSAFTTEAALADAAQGAFGVTRASGSGGPPPTRSDISRWLTTWPFGVPPGAALTQPALEEAGLGADLPAKDSSNAVGTIQPKESRAEDQACGDVHGQPQTAAAIDLLAEAISGPTCGVTDAVSGTGPMAAATTAATVPRSGSDVIATNGHLLGAVRRTISELHVATSGIAAGPTPGNWVFRSVRRTVGRSASAREIGGGGTAGTSAVAVIPSGSSSNGYTSGAAPPGPIPGGRVSQTPANHVLRRHRAMAEYVQSPLSRQGAGSVPGWEEVQARQPEVAYVRMGGSMTASGWLAGSRKGTQLSMVVAAAAAAPLRRPGSSSMSGAPGAQPIPAIQQQQQQHGAILRSRSGGLVIEEPGLDARVEEKRTKPQPASLVADAATAVRTALVQMLGGHSSGTISADSVRIRLLQATLDGALHSTPEAAAVAAVRRISRRSTNTFSDPGHGGSTQAYTNSSRLPRPLGVATCVREVSRGPGSFSAVATQLMNRSVLMLDLGVDSPTAQRPSNGGYPLPATGAGPATSESIAADSFGPTSSNKSGMRVATMPATITSPAVIAAGSAAIPSASGTIPRRRPPVRSSTPPPRMPTHTQPSYFRGSSHGYGLMSAAGGHNHCGMYSNNMGYPVGQQESSRVWGGLEALIEAYTQAAKQRGAMSRVPPGGGARPRGSVSVSSGAAAADSVATGATGTLFDSRALPDGRSSDSRGVMMCDSAILQGMIEVAQGSNGNGNGNGNRDSSALPFLSSRDGGRDSNTSRLMNALGTALRSKRISRGGTLVSIGEPGNTNVSKRFSVLSGGRESASTSRGEALVSGCGSGPATVMEAMLQLATGGATAHQLAGPFAVGGGGSITGLRRSVSPLSLLGGGSNGGRNTQPRMAALMGRDSEGSQAAGSQGGVVGSASGHQQLQPQLHHQRMGSLTRTAALTAAGASAGTTTSPDGGSPPAESASCNQISLPHLRGQALAAARSSAVALCNNSGSWTAQASQVAPLATRFPSYLFQLSRAESFGTNGNDSSDSAATPGPTLGPRVSPTPPGRGRTQVGVDGGRGSMGGGGSGTGLWSGSTPRRHLYDTRSAKFPSVYGACQFTGDGGASTNGGGAGVSGHMGGWPLSRVPSAQRGAAGGPFMSCEARRASGELTARVIPSGPYVRLSGQPGASNLYGLTRIGSGASRIAAAGGTPSHSEVLPGPLRMRAELDDAPDAFPSAEDDLPLHVFGKGRSASLGRERSSNRMSPSVVPKVITATDSVTASLRPYIGEVQNVCIAAVAAAAPEVGGGSATAAAAASAPSYSELTAVATGAGAGAALPMHAAASEPLYIAVMRSAISGRLETRTPSHRGSMQQQSAQAGQQLQVLQVKRSFGKGRRKLNEGVVGRAVRLSLQALRNFGATVSPAPGPPLSVDQTPTAAVAATASLTRGISFALVSGASGTIGPISSINESVDAPVWSASMATPQMSYTRSTADGAGSNVIGSAAAAAATAMPLTVSLHAANPRTSSKGEAPSGHVASSTGVAASRMSSQRERSFAQGSLLEADAVMVSGLQEALSSNTDTQFEGGRGLKLLNTDGSPLPSNHVAGVQGVIAAEIEPIASMAASAVTASVGPSSGSYVPAAYCAAPALTAPMPALSAVQEAAASVGDIPGGAAAAAAARPASSGGRSGRRRPVSRNPTPERLMAGLTRRLDSLISHGSDMPQWEAAAREGFRSRQASGAASLVGRIGAGMVQKIAPGSKKAMAQHQSASLDGTICFRGFRVRCGMHSGLEEGRDLHWAKVGGRRAYSGPAMALAKAVSDLVPGGMVLLTASTFERLQPWPNSEALPGAIIWSRGRFRVSVGESTDSAAPLREADLYQLLSPQLLARQPFLERRSWRGAEQVLPGVLNAPLGRLALVLVQVAGVQVLRAWNSEVTEAALQLFGSVAGEMLPAWGGFPASLDLQRGTLLAAFREPALALGFMHALIDVLRDADWPPELLTHELGEPLAVPLSSTAAGAGGVGGSCIPGISYPAEGVSSVLPMMSMSVSGAPPGPAAEGGGFLFRGLRVRCVADVASVRVDLGCATAAALYEARDPKALKTLRRMLALARMGAVLCSGLLVSEVLSGPPSALVALHDLLAFAPLVRAAAPPPPSPPPLALLPSPLPTYVPGSLGPSPSPSILPSPLPLTSPHIVQSQSGHGGPPVGRSSVNFTTAAAATATASGILPGGSTIPVSARLTRKEGSRSAVYQCTRRRPVRRSGMGQAGFALVGSVSGVYGAVAGMYGNSLFGGGASSVNSGGGGGGGGEQSGGA